MIDNCLIDYKYFNFKYSLIDYINVKLIEFEDDDECGSLFRKCPIGVPCVNLPGTYECYCPTGTKKNVQFYGTDCDGNDNLFKIPFKTGIEF